MAGLLDRAGMTRNPCLVERRGALIECLVRSRGGKCVYDWLGPLTPDAPDHTAGWAKRVPLRMREPWELFSVPFFFSFFPV